MRRGEGEGKYHVLPRRQRERRGGEGIPYHFYCGARRRGKKKEGKEEFSFLKPEKKKKSPLRPGNIERKLGKRRERSVTSLDASNEGDFVLSFPIEREKKMGGDAVTTSMLQRPEGGNGCGAENVLTFLNSTNVEEERRRKKRGARERFGGKRDTE